MSCVRAVEFVTASANAPSIRLWSTDQRHYFADGTHDAKRNPYARAFTAIRLRVLVVGMDSE